MLPVSWRWRQPPLSSLLRLTRVLLRAGEHQGFFDGAANALLSRAPSHSKNFGEHDPANTVGVGARIIPMPADAAIGAESSRPWDSASRAHNRPPDSDGRRTVPGRARGPGQGRPARKDLSHPADRPGRLKRSVAGLVFREVHESAIDGPIEDAPFFRGQHGHLRGRIL